MCLTAFLGLICFEIIHDFTFLEDFFLFFHSKLTITYSPPNYLNISQIFKKRYIILFTPGLLKRDLSNVDNKFDLNNVRYKWNGKLVNVRLFSSENDVIDNTIMWNVVISGEWPAVGHFVCPKCLKHAEDVNINIGNHVDRMHQTNPIEICHNAPVAKIIGRSHIWKLEKEGNEDIIIESVYTCTVEGCNYFTYCRRNYYSHLPFHKLHQGLVAKFGFFWSPIIHGAKCGRMIKASDIFRDREGYGCPYCED